MNNLLKKPIKGGIPAIENKFKAKNTESILLFLLKTFKSKIVFISNQFCLRNAIKIAKKHKFKLT